MSTKKKADSQELVVIDAIAAMDPVRLEQSLQTETHRRKIISSFIQKNLTEGTDFGKIHVASKDKCPKPWECKNEYHFSKPCLFKPGAEKFCSLLQLRAEFVPDTDTLVMAGSTSGLIAYRCHLIHLPSGSVVTEGRGSCAVSEKGGVVNTAIKIAEKRAQIDAVLRLGLSDSFTQDMEDLPEQAPVTPKTEPDPKGQDDIRMYAFIKRADMANINKFIQDEFSMKFNEIGKRETALILNMLEKKYGPLEVTTTDVPEPDSLT